MSGRIPEAFIDDLLNRVDIADLVGARLPLKRAGAEFKARCPFHDERTPSFTVSPAKQFYHCFGCGAHGTAITFLMEHDGLDFVEAVEDLAALCGLQVPREGGAPAPVRRGAPGSAPLIAVQERASRYFQLQLRRHPDAGRVIDYLKSRGLSGSTAARYRLGFAPSGWSNLLEAFGAAHAASLEAAGLAISRAGGGRYDRFRNRLMFPILDTRGRTIGFGGRTLAGDTPKYLNSPETPVFHKGRELYGLHNALQRQRHPQRAVVVEGYMDVLALAQAGIDCPVATLGTAPTPEHLQRLFRVTDRVLFCFDGDDAGRRAAQRAMEIALAQLREGRRVAFAFLAEGDDPDTLVQREGGAAIERLLDAAVPLSEFLFAGLLEQTDLHSLDGRARLVGLARPHLAKVPAGAFRDLLVTRTAELARLSEPQVRRMLDATAPARAPRHSATAATVPAAPPLSPLVTKCLRLLLADPTCIDTEEAVAVLGGIEVPGIDLLREAVQLFRGRPGAAGALFLERCRGRPEERTVATLLRQGASGATDSPLRGTDLDSEAIAVEFRAVLQALARHAERRKRFALMANTQSLSTLSEKEKTELRRLGQEPG